MDTFSMCLCPFCVAVFFKCEAQAAEARRAGQRALQQSPCCCRIVNKTSFQGFAVSDLSFELKLLQRRPASTYGFTAVSTCPQLSALTPWCLSLSYVCRHGDTC